MNWLLLAMTLPLSAQAGTCPRGSTPVDACYRVEGTLSGANGNPTFRLHPEGSKRILGVRHVKDTDKPDMPEALLTLLQNKDTGVGWKSFSGSFEVCPLTKQKPGRMEMVCITQFSQVAVRTKPDRNLSNYSTVE